MQCELIHACAPAATHKLISNTTVPKYLSFLSWIYLVPVVGSKPTTCLMMQGGGKGLKQYNASVFKTFIVTDLKDTQSQGNHN